MNYNNLAQKTNFIAGSDKFKNLPFFLTSINVPGLTFSHPEIGGRNSVRMKASADTVTYNPLSFEMLIDEDFQIYQELMELINKNINIKNGTFKDFYFDFWIELNNNKGNKVLKIEFSNCRIESIGDLELNTQDDSTEHVLSVDMTFDFYEIQGTRRYVLSNSIIEGTALYNRYEGSDETQEIYTRVNDDINNNQLTFTDDFTNISDTWQAWGFPTPIIVQDYESSNGYALDSNGDGTYESGVVSNGLAIDVLKPFSFTFRVKQPLGSTSNDAYYLNFGVCEGIGVQSTTSGRTGSSVMEVIVDGGSISPGNTQRLLYRINGDVQHVQDIGNYSNDGQYHEYKFTYTPNIDATIAQYSILKDGHIVLSATDSVSTHDFLYLFIQGKSSNGPHHVDRISGIYG